VAIGSQVHGCLKIIYMKNYTVYFEIYGKKLKTTVMANNREHAEEIIRNKIIFHKIALMDDDKDDLFSKEDDMPPNDGLDYLKNILGIKD